MIRRIRETNELNAVISHGESTFFGRALICGMSDPIEENQTDLELHVKYTKILCE
jgi:hypothetical protein